MGQCLTSPSKSHADHAAATVEKNREATKNPNPMPQARIPPGDSRPGIPTAEDKPDFIGGTGPTFECSICVETTPLRKSFNPEGCAHIYCNQCTVRYIETQLSEHSSTRISCPEPGCQGILDPELCRQILPRNLFDRWGNALADSAIDASQKFYCPYSDCSVLLVNDGGGGEVDCRRSRGWGFLCLGRIETNPKRATCPSCKRAVCVDCKCAWHSEMECETYQKLKGSGGEEGMVNWLAAKKRWKKCPNCRSLVERRSGCSYIICRCGKAFCYVCSSLFVNGVHVGKVYNGCYANHGVR